MKVENNLPEPFIHNEYYEKMMAIINKAKLNPPTENFEKHHIIPKSYYKKLSLPVISKNNIVKLSFVEHMLVHFYAVYCANDIIKYAMYQAATNFFKVDVSLLPEDFIKEYAEKIINIRNAVKTNNGWLEWAKENDKENYKRYLDNVRMLNERKEEIKKKKILRRMKHTLYKKDNRQIKWLKYRMDMIKYLVTKEKEVKPIKYLLMCNETGKKYTSIGECADDLRLDKKAIGNALCAYQAGHHSVHGYTFSYCDEAKRKMVEERIRLQKEQSRINILRGYEKLRKVNR